MARIRSIKPEFWVSEQIAECSPNARLTFVGMWNFCDDRGVHPAKPKTLKAELYPMDDITAVHVGEWVAELVQVGLVREFDGLEDGERYWHVTGWDRHQKIDRPSYKHPAPPPQDSANARRVLAEDSPNARRAPPPGVDRNGEDRKGVESDSPKARASSSRKRRPSVQQTVELQALVAAGFDLATAEEFIAVKSERKAPLTVRAWEAHCREAKKAGLSPLQAAERVLEKTWMGFEAKYVEGDRISRAPVRRPLLDADEQFTGAPA